MTTRLKQLTTVAVLVAATTMVAQGQIITFNKAHHSVVEGASVGRSIREFPDGYLVFGGQTQLDTTKFDCTVSKFDHNGTLLGEFYLQYPRYEVFGSSDPVSGQLPDGGYMAAFRMYGGGYGLDSIIGIRFDQYGDSLWTRLLLADSLCFSMDVVATNGSYFFLGQRVHDLQASEVAYVLRTDTLGNWEHFIGELPIVPSSLAVDTTNNLYIAGRWNNKGFLMKLDSTGTAVWSRYQQKPVGHWHGVKHIFGNRILCLGNWRNYALFTPPGEEWDNNMYLALYDANNGTLIWDYEGLKGKPTTFVRAFFTDAYQDTDSTFVTCGVIQQVMWNRGVVSRFTRDGELLWQRTYAYYSDLSNLFPQQPWDIEPTSDGGMVLTGEAWVPDTIPPYSNQNMWLLKLDSLGCLVPGCQFLDIDEIALGTGQALRAWPNPTDGTVHLELDLPRGLAPEGPLLLQVFDMQGRLALRRELGTSPRGTFTIDLAGQPPGLYSAHLSDERRILGGAKIIRQ